MNHFISLDQAKQMTARYREQKDNILKPEFVQSGVLSISETFERAAFDRLLSQPGCTSLRIYNGMSEDLKLRAIIVGVNEKDEDMLPISQASTLSAGTATDSGDDDNVIVEIGTLCPPQCGTPSDLNP